MKRQQKNIITLVQVSCKETLLYYYEMRPQNTIVLPKYYYFLVVEVTKTWEFLISFNNFFRQILKTTASQQNKTKNIYCLIHHTLL